MRYNVTGELSRNVLFTYLCIVFTIKTKLYVTWMYKLHSEFGCQAPHLRTAVFLWWTIDACGINEAIESFLMCNVFLSLSTIRIVSKFPELAIWRSIVSSSHSLFCPIVGRSKFTEEICADFTVDEIERRKLSGREWLRFWRDRYLLTQFTFEYLTRIQCQNLNSMAQNEFGKELPE